MNWPASQPAINPTMIQPMTPPGSNDILSPSPVTRHGTKLGRLTQASCHTPENRSTQRNEGLRIDVLACKFLVWGSVGTAALPPGRETALKLFAQHERGQPARE